MNNSTKDICKCKDNPFMYYVEGEKDRRCTRCNKFIGRSKG